MTGPATGIVLPADVLTSNWFILLLTVVALNTIIYVGLTLAKLLPMPRQVHPSRVRRYLRALGMDPEKDTAVNHIPTPEPLDTTDPFDDMRGATVRRDVPLAFGISGVLVILVASAGFITFGLMGITLHIVELSTGVLFIVLAQLFSLRPFRAGPMMWAWAMACVALVVLSIVRSYYYETPLPLVYAYIVMTAFAPIALYWRPILTAGALMLAALGVATQLTEGRDGVRILIAGVGALLVGAMLLRLRLKAIEEWSNDKARSQALVTTDVLTGTLTPRGLLTIMPAIAGIAERTGEQVCLMYFSVQDIAAANAQYGAHYGDDVLRAVATTIQGAVRRGDLVARWRGAEFLVAGIGSRPSADELARRVREALQRSTINLGKWPTTFSVGTAAGDPRETTFDNLLSEAIADCATMKAEPRAAS
ncbi:GGDEF domain-containing protein [Mycobacterium sp. B14F4]|uniref:GGDEF domain-containing protein n=1 Tax=Mycobacterium sp. B14F4 TaxID=3153565 RepID=UPI00325D5FE6